MATQNPTGSATLNTNWFSQLPDWLKSAYNNVIKPYVVQPAGDIANASSEALRQGVGVPTAIAQDILHKPNTTGDLSVPDPRLGPDYAASVNRGNAMGPALVGMGMPPTVGTEEALPYLANKGKAAVSDAVKATQEGLDAARAEPGGLQAGFVKIPGEGVAPKPEVAPPIQTPNLESAGMVDAKGNPIKSPLPETPPPTTATEGIDAGVKYPYKPNPINTVPSGDAGLPPVTGNGVPDLGIPLPKNPNAPGKTVTKIWLDPKVGAPQEQAAVQNTIDNFVPGKTATEQYANLKPTMDEFGNQIQTIMKNDPRAVTLDQVLKNYDANLEAKGLYRSTTGLSQTELQDAAAQYVRDLTHASVDENGITMISDQSLHAAKQAINQDAKSVFRKIQLGTTLNAQDQVVLAAQKTVDDTLAQLHPDVKQLTTMQSHLYEAVDSLNAGAKSEYALAEGSKKLTGSQSVIRRALGYAGGGVGRTIGGLALVGGSLLGGYKLKSSIQDAKQGPLLPSPLDKVGKDQSNTNNNADTGKNVNNGVHTNSISQQAPVTIDQVPSNIDPSAQDPKTGNWTYAKNLVDANGLTLLPSAKDATDAENKFTQDNALEITRVGDGTASQAEIADYNKKLATLNLTKSRAATAGAPGGILDAQTTLDKTQGDINNIATWVNTEKVAPTILAALPGYNWSSLKASTDPRFAILIQKLQPIAGLPDGEKVIDSLLKSGSGFLTSLNEIMPKMINFYYQKARTSLGTQIPSGASGGNASGTVNTDGSYTPSTTDLTPTDNMVTPNISGWKNSGTGVPHPFVFPSANAPVGGGGGGLPAIPQQLSQQGLPKQPIRIPQRYEYR